MNNLKDANQNPFPGLRPFEIEEYHLFFGRDGHSDEIVKRLRLTRFVAVVGTSGSGKSSLIRAGLLPALYGGLMAGVGSAWHVVLMRPGHDPIGNLAYELGQAGALSEDSFDLETQNTLIETVLRRSTLGLVDVVRQACSLAQENLLIVVDQFEELFRFKKASNKTSSIEDAAQFVKLLIAASAQVEVPIYVVLTMRSDFLGDCSQFAGLPEAINQAQYLIPRMSRDERHAAITGPISVGGGEITQPLVNRLLNDVGDNPDQLPILQHALMRTWNYWATHRRNGNDIGLEDYEAIGTMTEALSRHADEACAELKDERSRGIAEKLFKLLTEKGDDNREIRRPTQLADICDVTEATPDEVIAVVNVFRSKGRSFLMPPEGIDLTGDTIIDISHESLIRNWEVLKRWTAEEAESGRMYRRLSDAWKDFGDSPLPDTLLDAAVEWRKRCEPNPAWVARYRRPSEQEPSFDEVISFIERSQAAREARIKEQKHRAEEELARQRRELENAATLADQERRLAETERERAEERAVANQRELELAKVFAKKQATAATRLRVVIVALAMMLLVAVYAVVIARNARAAADVDAKNAIAAKDVAQKAQAIADRLQGDAKKNADKLEVTNRGLEEAKKNLEITNRGLEKAKKDLQVTNTGLEKAKKDLEFALDTARSAEATALAKEAEAVRLRNNEAKARLANEHFRDGFTEPNLEKASQDFQQAAKEFEGLADFIAAGASYLQSAKVWANNNNPFETPNEKLVATGFDGAIRSFRTASNTPDATKREDAKKREAAALVAQGEYLTESLFGAGPVNSERFKQGIESLDAALVIYRDSNNLDGRITTLRTIASKYKENNEPQKAINSQKETIPLYETKKDWTELTKVLFELAEDDAANKVEHLDKILKITKEHDDPKNQTQTVMHVAAYYLDHQKDESDLKRADDLYRDLAAVYPAGQANKEAAALLAEIGARLRFATSEKAKDLSGDYYKRALDVYLSLGNKDALSEIFNGFFSAPDILQRWPKGFEYLEKFLAILDPESKTPYLLGIGNTRLGFNQLPQALDAYQRALVIFKTRGESGSQASTLMDIGKIQASLKQLTNAIESFKQAQEIYHRLNETKSADTFDPYGEEAIAFSSIGSVQENLGSLREAIDSYTNARDLYKKSEFGEMEAAKLEAKIQEIKKRLQKP